MMDIKRIAAIYRGGLQISTEVLQIDYEALFNGDLKKKELYRPVKDAAETVVMTMLDIFEIEFPDSFAECVNSEVFDIETFYKLINENTEIIVCCGDKFFDFVKQHVETDVSGLKKNQTFDCNWAYICGILNSDQAKDYVIVTKSPAFEKMVLAIARHIDLIQAQKQQMAILFFKNAAEFDYPNFRERIIENLQKNQSFEAWINEAIETLKKGEV